jgi:glutaredoxin 2
MKPGSSARQIWAAIDNLFRGNKKSRAIALEAEFRNTPQGNMMVHDYCAKLKSLADALADVDQAVSDETLVLTVLRGLNEKFSHLRSFIPF